jgi:hypothetical protein
VDWRRSFLFVRTPITTPVPPADKCIFSYFQIGARYGFSRRLRRRRRGGRFGACRTGGNGGLSRARGGGCLRRSCGRLRRSGGRWARRRLGSFGLLLTRREKRGTGQNADVFFHSHSWKGHIALID